MRSATGWAASFWGRGIATRALSLFLDAIESRPLYARVAKDNSGSLRVVERCGFTILGAERGFANARGEEIAKVVLVLAADTHAIGNGR